MLQASNCWPKEEEDWMALRHSTSPCISLGPFLFNYNKGARSAKLRQITWVSSAIYRLFGELVSKSVTAAKVISGRAVLGFAWNLLIYHICSVELLVWTWLLHSGQKDHQLKLFTLISSGRRASLQEDLLGLLRPICPRIPHPRVHKHKTSVKPLDATVIFTCISFGCC